LGRKKKTVVVAAACGIAIGARTILQGHTRGLRPIFFGYQVIMEFIIAHQSNEMMCKVFKQSKMLQI